MSNSPKKDYYGTLNLSKDADENAIKKAYRSLAQKYHPDKNKDPEAENKFKEITEAYSVLSDNEKKQKYDQYGICDGEAPDFSQGYPDMDEILRAMGMGGMSGMSGMGGMGGFPGMGGMGGFPGMGGMGRSNQREKPIQEHIEKLKVHEIFYGQSKNINIVFNDKCNSCEGSGSKTKFKTTCSGCKGSGVKVTIRQVGPGMISQQQSVCNDCNGRGKFVEPKERCSACNGNGTIESKLNKTIEITKNFDYENILLLKNSGNYDPDTNTKADINIKFVITDIDKFNMSVKNSYDLWMECSINIYDALCGYSLYLDLHPDEKKYHLKFTDIIKDKDVKFAKNMGLPYSDEKKNIKRGKLYIKFKYIYPSEVLDSENYKNFIKTKDTKQVDKESYTRVKTYDISEDNVKSNNHRQQRGQDSGSGGGEENPTGCVQS